MTFQADLAGLQAKLPDYITAVTYAPDVRTISLTTTLSPPHNQVSVLLSQDYVERYPRGAVHFLVGQTFNTVSVSSQCEEPFSANRCALDRFLITSDSNRL